MKSIKMIGLAALAALTAMAFVGVSSAMAENTQLCKKDVGDAACPAGEAITHVHEETAAGAKAKILTAIGTIECDVLFLSTAVLVLGKPQVIHGHFTWTNCVRGNEKCTVTEVSIDALIEVLRLGSELADVTYKYEVNVMCGFFITCTYDGEKLKGHGLGALSAPPNGETRVEEQELHKGMGGILCPEAKLDILTKPLEPTYIAL